jgi:aryl-alcohol dehydrogenase-like predicted oxidoreductase
MRDRVIVATKFGWDIDQETGEHRGRVNSMPEQIRRSIEGSLSGCAPTTSICNTRFEENIGALRVTLTPADLDEIQAANVTIHGARYPDAVLRLSGR